MKTGRLCLLASCFFFSGVAGLIYQTAWTQQLAQVFGTSEQATAAVLAAYFGGLALGAAVASRWVHRWRRPVLIYAVLELGIGLTALAVPTAITMAGRLQAVVFGGAEVLPSAGALGPNLFDLAAAFAILVVPTTLMGATLPLLARDAVHRSSEIGPRIGLLYAANTAGAATGTLATAFLLLPRLGLGQTIGVGAGVNVLVFFMAIVLVRNRAVGDASLRGPLAAGPRWILPVVMISGAVSFTWEILWTRLLAPLLGGSVYAFTTMLASFLFGLALGSALVARLATTPERARRLFVVAQIAIAGLSLAAFAMVGHLPRWIRRWAETGDGSVPGGGAFTSSVLSMHLLSSSVSSAILLLPGALAIGATFPLVVRILSHDAGDAATASAKVFAWNTVGAIAGALLTGYYLLPMLGFAGTVTVAATVSLLLAAVTALGVAPRRPLLGVAAAVGLIALAVARPATPWSVLRYSSLTAQSVPGKVVHLWVSVAAVRSYSLRITARGVLPPMACLSHRSGRPRCALAAMSRRVGLGSCPWLFVQRPGRCWSWGWALA